MKPFLQKIAERLIDKFPEKMDHIAVVLPSKRSIVFLKHYLSNLITKPIFLPKFFSIEQFVEYISGYNVLDNISLQFHLYQTYLKSNNLDQISFDKFIGWSNILLNDFNDVDRNLINPKHIFLNLREVKNLDNWGADPWSLSDPLLTNLQQEYVSFYDHIYDWYLDFNQSLSNCNFAYQGMAYRKSAEKIVDFEFAFEKIWFVGLNALTKSEERIINSLKEKNIARVFWDADEFYYNNSQHEAGEFLRVQKHKWNEINFEGVGNYFNQKKQNFSIISCPKDVSQARAAGSILSNLSDQDLKSSNTAIILADENLLYPVLNHLPENIKDINITMGSPLSQYPLFSFFQHIFNMQLNAKQDQFHYKDFLDLINHPIFIQFVGLDFVNSIKSKIVTENKVFISSEYILSKFKFINENVSHIFYKWKDSKQAISSLRNIIYGLRNDLIGQRNSVSSEVIYTFHKCLRLIDDLFITHNIFVKVNTFYKILNQLLSREIVPFSGEPLKGVQLMGVLESRTLDFKNLIILSVNEGCLPKGDLKNSFIPYDLKKYFNIPTNKDHDSIFSYHFYRLLQRAQNINIMYNSEMDHLGSAEKSRFVTQLLAEYPYEINEFVYSGGDLIFSNHKDIIVENKDVFKQIIAWSQNVSPTALNMYNSCSLSFYYYYLVGIRKHDEINEFSGSDVIGSVIHESFQDVYPIGIVKSDDIDSIRERLFESIKDQFILHSGHQDIYAGKNYIALEVAKSLTDNFITYEKSYLLNSSLSYIFLG